MILALAARERSTRTATERICKKQQYMAKTEQTVNVNSISRISSGTYFKGELSSPYDLRIDGIFDGKIFSKGRVVIGETADVSGEVMCENVDLWGTMKGIFYVKDTLVLKSDCNMAGELHTRKLFVELGAIFNGTCKMISEKDYDALVSKSELPGKMNRPLAPAAEAPKK